VVLVAPLCTFARVGETLAQCEARYGKGTEYGDAETCIFSKAGISVGVHLYQGKVDQIAYWKEEGTFSTSETEAFLKANCSNKRWIKADGGSWTTEDRGIVASLSLGTDGKGYLVISTKEFDERREKDEKAEEKKRLEGF
jgi:hypothetical protein